MNFLPRSRWFSSSACRLATHYDTLAIPRDASRAQIKSKFYTLSKELHPDTHPNDPAAKSKFQKITEAYSVLGDERQRRAYDRTLADRTHSPASNHSHEHTWEYEYSYRRGSETSRHAWQHPRRRAQWSHSHSHPRQAPFSSPFDGDPFSSPHVRNATGRHEFHPGRRRSSAKDSRTSASKDSEHREAVSESGLIRFVQVTSMVLFLMMATGVGHASAA
ncbi:DnaJ-domain-containing protein [Sistotremastrum suecicum HHB10207 ss-3]|uniref:DnaJ-domain-containing protein n=1 Tax=Sistotremastrum suecicum HHB10207 ss-3 TaxID=1314776 RepID=A0A166FSW4_9AGAM|nr:DnaJ-domain-containing protein [Sistotremastrum suecicum HHB10207 ss-3]